MANKVLQDSMPLFANQCDPAYNVTVTLHQFAESLGMAIDLKDDLTRTHSQEVAILSYDIALAMGLPEELAVAIHVAGHLHDIGKIGIADSILKKEGPLTEEEWRKVKEHPALGYAILKPVSALTEGNRIADMVLHHHERFDGSGYPMHLSREEIPLGARIIAVADAMSAMIGNRRYRQADAWHQAIQEIENCAGSHFDPAVVQAFLRIEKNCEKKLRPHAAVPAFAEEFAPAAPPIPA